MTDTEKQEVCYEIDMEGFDGVFIHRSSFSEIKDDQFHKLREAYIKSTEELKKYIEYEKYGGVN